MAAEQLSFPAEWASALERYLPPRRPGRGGDGDGDGHHDDAGERPFVTLTFATSLDAGLALAPGTRTRLSGPESKAMTHYLRSRHAAVLVGVATVLADDPALNCRLAGAGATQQPRPVVLDPRLRWTPRPGDGMLAASRRGAGLAPLVLTAVAPGEVPRASADELRRHGGRFVHVAADAASGRFAWCDVLAALRAEGLASVMIEGGARVVAGLLHPANHAVVDAVVVTLAPLWLGRGAALAAPDRVLDAAGRPAPAARLADVAWLSLGDDLVVCGRLRD